LGDQILSHANEVMSRKENHVKLLGFEGEPSAQLQIQKVERKVKLSN
jgi:hypothetical protein